MQLYHHPYSLDSQKVRLALEEKGIDYTSHHVNPITGKNMDPFFFRMNPSAKLPLFQNGSHVIYDTLEIIKGHAFKWYCFPICWCKGRAFKRYAERIAMVSSGIDNPTLSSPETIAWMQKVQQWDPKYFTLIHIPDKHRLFVSKFLRRIIIARMSESPDLASSYHRKLREEYETEEKLRDPQVLRRSEEELVRLLDEVEAQLSKTSYLSGEEFTLADVVLIPVLARLVLLNLEDKYINSRYNVAEYWNMVKMRPSYKKVIGKYFDGWKKKKTLLRTWCFVHIRSLLNKY